jgi:hypothetical protein
MRLLIYNILFKIILKIKIILLPEAIYLPFGENLATKILSV